MVEGLLDPDHPGLAGSLARGTTGGIEGTVGALHDKACDLAIDVDDSRVRVEMGVEEATAGEEPMSVSFSRMGPMANWSFDLTPAQEMETFDMARAREAREWAQGNLRGIADSLFTPFSGEHGDDIDFDAYRAIIRYCLGDLDHDGLWITSGLAEWWALTMDERKQLVEVTVDEARPRQAHGVHPGLHPRHECQGHGRAHPTCPRRWRGHLLSTEPRHGGPRGCRDPRLLPLCGGRPISPSACSTHRPQASS